MFPLPSNLLEVPSVNKSLMSVLNTSTEVNCTLYNSYSGMLLYMTSRDGEQRDGGGVNMKHEEMWEQEGKGVVRV